jgi:two-component system response regulator ResD
MMQKILVVDDEARIRDIIRQYVEFEGFECYEAEDGVIAYQMARTTEFDLILLDVMMPNCDGITTLRKIREFSDVPVILLTAKGEEYDKVFGFDLGADDYVVKPFSPKELMSRIKAILKRTQKTSPTKDEVYTFRGLTVNPKSYEVKIDGEKVTVTPKEFELLLYFIQNKNTVITRDAILNHIWGYDFYGDSRTVDTHIKMLRSNLGEYRDLIKTVWGVGYKYEEY